MLSGFSHITTECTAFTDLGLEFSYYLVNLQTTSNYSVVKPFHRVVKVDLFDVRIASIPISHPEIHT